MASPRSTFQLDLRVYGALPTPGGPVFATPQTARPFFDRQPSHHLDQAAKRGCAGGYERLQSMVAIASGFKLAGEVIEGRAPTLHFDYLARGQLTARTRVEAKVRSALVRNEHSAQVGVDAFYIFGTAGVDGTEDV